MLVTYPKGRKCGWRSANRWGLRSQGAAGRVVGRSGQEPAVGLPRRHSSDAPTGERGVPCHHRQLTCWREHMQLPAPSSMRPQIFSAVRLDVALAFPKVFGDQSLLKSPVPSSKVDSRCCMPGMMRLTEALGSGYRAFGPSLPRQHPPKGLYQCRSSGRKGCQRRQDHDVHRRRNSGAALCPFPINTSWSLSWYSPLLRAKATQQDRCIRINQGLGRLVRLKATERPQGADRQWLLEDLGRNRKQ